MRKWIVPVLVMLVILFGALYFTLPHATAIKTENRFAVNTKAFTRMLFDTGNWHRWWPQSAEKGQPAGALFFRDNQYQIVELKHSSIVVAIANGKDSALTELLLIPVSRDTVQLLWAGTGKTANGPAIHLQRKGWIKNINKDLSFVLQKVKEYHTREDNLYGLKIREQSVVDSMLVSTAANFPDYPTPDGIYRMIDQLKVFVQTNGAGQAGFPMLHINQNTDSTYTAKVAIPVNKILADEGAIRFRRMLGGGNILVTEVKGGRNAIEKGFSVMKQYMEDHNRLAPAIPFQSLVTDRKAEPDSAKWITKLYWPVM